MYKVYFKQAIELLKQNKFISTISIIGTALAIMMVMVLIVVDQVKNANIAPENNRSELLYINRSKLTGKKHNTTRNGNLDFEEIELIKNKVKSAAKVSFSDGFMMDFIERTSRTKDSKVRTILDTRATDANFWDIFSFNFIAGKPFSQIDFDSGLKKVVVSERIAKQFYGKKDAIGEDIIINTDTYIIVGVVKDVSKVFKNAYAQAWIPYTSVTNYKQILHFEAILLPEKNKLADIEKAIESIEQEYNQTNEVFNLEFQGPYNHRDSQINVWEFEKQKKIEARRMIFLFSILLLIPAINLSGLSLSRVRRRIEEIGIRKAFGAKRNTILIQILYENFITSLLGGIIGMILSFLVVTFMKEWLLGATDSMMIPLQALISFPIFIAVFLISFILNLLSSGVPAWYTANMNIIDSLNHKK